MMTVRKEAEFENSDVIVNKMQQDEEWEGEGRRESF
jgi:hypothetical protein